MQFMLNNLSADTVTNTMFMFARFFGWCLSYFLWMANNLFDRVVEI